MYLVFTRMPGESYRRRLGSLLLHSCYVFRALINSLVCWFLTETGFSCCFLFLFCFSKRPFNRAGHITGQADKVVCFSHSDHSFFGTCRVSLYHGRCLGLCRVSLAVLFWVDSRFLAPLFSRTIIQTGSLALPTVQSNLYSLNQTGRLARPIPVNVPDPIRIRAGSPGKHWPETGRMTLAHWLASGPDPFGQNLAQSARTKSAPGWFCIILSGTSLEERNRF